MTNKDLELKLLLRESHIQQLKLKILKLEQEIERLNNIINKAIEYIEEHTENIDRGRYYEDYVETYPILQILKGVDKE